MRLEKYSLDSTSWTANCWFKWASRILNNSLCGLVAGVLGISLAYGQQPTTDSATVDTNARYVQGVGPGYRPSVGTGAAPTLNIGAGTAFCNGTLIEYSGTPPLTLAPGTPTTPLRNYIYLDPTANCAPTSNITGFSPGHIPIATADTNDTTIIPGTLKDVRNWFHATLPNIHYADAFPGANAGEKIKNCINALPSTGGICDARGFEGTQTLAVDPTLMVGTATKPVTLLLGAVTFTTTKPITLAKGSQIIGLGKATVISSGIKSASCSLTSSACATIIVASERVVLRDFKLVYAETPGTCETGSTACSIGLDIGVGPSGTVGHHIAVRNVEVTRPDGVGGTTPGFSIGLRVQNTFYGGFHDLDVHTNNDYNLLVTNTAISNDFVNFRSRGTRMISRAIR
ncbi:MAG: hypothetical protein HYR55_10235 [Acidobacteria bacterium]|nr:hypothetical protein [Acidobacteriota bacterium]MBI3658308.1 hypothetical protein [Acidobacteriota bacterium]